MNPTLYRDHQSSGMDAVETNLWSEGLCYLQGVLRVRTIASVRRRASWPKWRAVDPSPHVYCCGLSENCVIAEERGGRRLLRFVSGTMRSIPLLEIVLPERRRSVRLPAASPAECAQQLPSSQKTAKS
ncbi:hypothetical protein MRX96_019021 [Rhipicephalus microplus]